MFDEMYVKRNRDGTYSMIMGGYRDTYVKRKGTLIRRKMV